MWLNDEDRVADEDVHKYKIVKIRETLLQMQICTTIPPELKHTINDELIKAGLKECGTSIGWQLDESIKPVKCEDFEDRWHYLCKC